MRSLPLALAALAVPSLADARPITAGVGLGVIQSKVDAQADANHTLAVFGRLGFTPRLAGQLELQRIQTDDTSIDIRTGTALVVLDLGTHGHLIPTLLAGLGLDDASSSWGGDTTGHHFEAGVGLEYRFEGGFTIGADARIGARSIDSDYMAYPVAGALYYTPSTLHDGEYRSAHVTAGIRF